MIDSPHPLGLQSGVIEVGEALATKADRRDVEDKLRDKVGCAEDKVGSRLSTLPVFSKLIVDDKQHHMPITTAKSTSCDGGFGEEGRHHRCG